MKERPGPYRALRPHSLAAMWRHRDQCVRLRLGQVHASRVIQHAFKVHSVWRRISLKVYARRVALWYKRILEERKRCNRLRLFILNRSASKIQRRCMHAMQIMKRASLQIQRASRGRIGRLRAKHFKLEVQYLLLLGDSSQLVPLPLI